MFNEHSPRNLIILWSVVLMGLAVWQPTGYWTIDDGIKSISATRGQGMFGSPIPDDTLRGKLSNSAAYPVFVEPFAERIENGVAPGFSPFSRMLAGIEGEFSRRALLLVTAIIAIGVGWTFFAAGLAWGFVLLPLTFYGLVPWEHGVALCLSTPALIALFCKEHIHTALAAVCGILLAAATMLRPEHGLLLLAGMIYMLHTRRIKEGMLLLAGSAVCFGTLIMWAGTDEVFRQVLLNRSHADWSLSTRVTAVIDTVFSIGPNLYVSGILIAILLVSLFVLDKEGTPRVFRLLGWLGVSVYAFMIVKVVWERSYPPFAMLSTGSIAFAMPWMLWLVTKRDAWRTKAMPYAFAALAVGILLLPQSTGVHWGPRLLLFAAPLFVIALYKANLHTSTAFNALVLLSLIQGIHSGVVVYARMVESRDHEERLLPHIGTPLVTTSRSQAIDLAGLWDNTEFFVASSGDELKSLFVQFYELRLDSVWLHLMSSDSLLIKTFPNNKPVWPHKMTLVNCGNLYRSQWRLYQIVMNRADPEWIPLLEKEAGRATQAGDNKRALFLQNDIVRLNPNRAEAHHNMAVALARLGKNYDALKAVERALEIDSTLRPAQALRDRLQAAEAN